MHLEELLKVCNSQELGELYAFWNGEGERAPPSGDMARSVADRMTDELLVRRRLRFLSRKLADLLRFFLSQKMFEASLEEVRRSRAFSFMSPHEVEAAVRALVKRGFLFPETRTSPQPGRFVVPLELGELLRCELKDLDLDLAESFSLRRMLLSEPSSAWGRNGTSHAELDPEVEAQRLCDPRSVEERRSSLPEAVAKIFERAISMGGGLLPRSVVLRGNNGDAIFDRRTIKRALEEQRLGSVRHLALGEYGLNHFDDTVIVFEEVLAATLRSQTVDVTAKGWKLRTLGVDLLSDLSHLLGRLSRDKVRLTQNGAVYRTAARKIEEEMILTAKKVFHPERLFELLLDLAQSRHLVRRSADRALTLTAKGRTWARLSVSYKLKELLSGLLEDNGRHFHRARLRAITIERLGTLEIDRWYDFGLVAGLVRHHYLATLDDSGIRDAYQSRYQYSSEAHMRDLSQLAQMISEFLGTDLHLLGLVDLALEGERPQALKLTQLAAKALGKCTEAESPAPRTRLIVNPDFEILLFPEGDAYELIQKLDRFAERVSTEGAFRYRVTQRSVERAVAGSMSAAEILEVLSEHSDSEPPQNVVFSIRDYAEKVRFVRVQRAVLLSARHKEVIDHLLRRSDVRKVVIDRLSPRMLALNPSANLEELLPLLEEDGVFFEGESAHAEDVLGEHAPKSGNGTDTSAPNPEAPDERSA